MRNFIKKVEAPEKINILEIDIISSRKNIDKVGEGYLKKESNKMLINANEYIIMEHRSKRRSWYLEVRYNIAGNEVTSISSSPILVYTESPSKILIALSICGSLLISLSATKLQLSGLPIAGEI
jgi:hypothetical protein